MQITVTAFEPRVGNVREPRREYTDQELSTAFTKVKNSSDWKGPINRWIKEEDLSITERSVVHYTGSIVHVVGEKEGKVKIHADGYHRAVGM